MHRLSIAEAVKVIPVSESTLRRDLKSGKVSCTTNKQGKKVLDVSELERVYGELTINDNQKNGNDSDKIVSFLEEQVQDLKARLVKAEERESKLHDLLKEKEVNMRALMPPPETTKQNWWQRLTGR